MKKPILVALFCAVLHPLAAAASLQDATEQALRAAVESVADRVVRVRCFGDDGATLGTVTPALTGYQLDEGWVLTSLYGLESDPAAIVCERPSGAREAAVVSGRDHNRRLALLRTGEPSRPPRIEGGAARVGETAIAVGRVYSAMNVNLSVGVVSAVGRLGGRAVQTDAAISPTNYGGPLIGLDGRLIGLIVPLAPPGQSGVNLYDSGVGFAVPADQIGPRLSDLARGQDVHPGWLGIEITQTDPLRSAAEAASVSPDGPAARAGLLAGDVITSIGGRATPTAWTLRAALPAYDAGQVAQMAIERGGQTLAPVSITFARRPPPREVPDGAEAARPVADPSKAIDP